MRQHHFKDSGIDVLPLGDPVDLAAVAADDALIDALSGDVLAELLADDMLIEALVARMPPGTAPPRGDVLAGRYWPSCWPRGWPRRGGTGRGAGLSPAARRTLRNPPTAARRALSRRRHTPLVSPSSRRGQSAGRSPL